MSTDLFVVHFSHSDSEGRTPLIWAVDRGNLSAVEILIAKGAEINAKVRLPSSIDPFFFWNYIC